MAGSASVSTGRRKGVRKTRGREPSPGVAAGLTTELERIAVAVGCRHAALGAAQTKLHRVDALFFAVARGLDRDGLARAVLRRLLARQGFATPAAGNRWRTTGSPG